MRDRRKVFWGVYLVLAAVALILFGMCRAMDFEWEFVEGIGLWHLVVGALLVGFTIKGIFDRNVGEILFSLAFLAIVFDEVLHIEPLTPWYVLAAALLGTIGLGMLIKPKNHWTKYCNCDWNDHGNHDHGNHNAGDSVEHVNGEKVWFKTNMGSGIKYVQTDNFQEAHLTNSFGSTKVYFDNAIIQPGVVPVIELNCSFGSIEIYVPKTWYVENKAHSSFGNIEEKNRAMSTGEPRVVLTGSVSFGSVEVIYI